jgi:xanthine dehydrogenase YagR molybdenum-binding subunit
LVLAQDSETARFAATLVHIDYDEEKHATDLHARLDKAYVVEKPTSRVAMPRGPLPLGRAA